MDSNRTRLSNTLQKLTFRQFIRRLNKLHRTCKRGYPIIGSLLPNYLLLLASKEDINYTLLNNRSALKYALSMCLFSLLHFSHIYKLKIKVELSQYPHSELGWLKLLNKYIGMVAWVQYLPYRNEEGFRVLTDIITYLIFIIYNLIQQTGNDYEHILYLSLEFYKELHFFQDEKTDKLAFAQLEKQRRKWDLKIDYDVKSEFEQYFLKKFNLVRGDHEA
jgi:hypothetical protein